MKLCAEGAKILAIKLLERAVMDSQQHAPERRRREVLEWFLYYEDWELYHSLTGRDPEGPVICPTCGEVRSMDEWVADPYYTIQYTECERCRVKA